MTHTTPSRNFTPGMGKAVANRTVTRRITRPVTAHSRTIYIPRRDDMALDKEVAEWCLSNGLVIDGYGVPHGSDLTVEVVLNVVGEVDVEKWADVAYRVAFGNSLLHPSLNGDLISLATERSVEFDSMHHHLRQASLLMSGRHLQHGDEMQPTRPGEVYTNCSSSASSFITFLLLLSGSGVGRSYDNEMMVVDYKNLPTTVCVCDASHQDVQSGEIHAMDRCSALHLYAGKKVYVFEVPDSREGWAKAVEKLELMAFQGKHRKDVLLLDFSKVRPRGAPIAGMQNRPASGPGSLMTAIANVAKLRNSGMERWRAAMYADHYLAECVLVGGARRAARMATKSWRDPNVLDFINVKRGGFLWSSNNSVTVDAEFWEHVKVGTEHGMMGCKTFSSHETRRHALDVFNAVCEAAYKDGTGEPGFINQDRLTKNDAGIEALFEGDFAKSERYELEPDTKELTRALVKAWKDCGCKMTVNPCSEVPLSVIGAYCALADVVPFHAASDADAEDAFRVATRALIRTNRMDFLYGKEVKRTNRIGVGITGIHEYAFTRFGLGWKDLVDFEVSKDFWLMLSRFKRAVQSEAKRYSALLDMNTPHSDNCIKPSGSVSKIFGLTEGAHLPSMREYLRWVQFRNDDPLVDTYRVQGYPVRKLQTYSGTTIVGFPTQPAICTLGMGDKLVTAVEATPEEQYEYLRLLEQFWIRGVEEDGVTPLRETGGQISYTLKFDPALVSFEDFKRTLMDGQSTVRCCSVMPQTDSSAYEYQPESAVTKYEYQQISNAIASATAGKKGVKEDVGAEHVGCAGGICPISFNENSGSFV